MERENFQKPPEQGRESISQLARLSPIFSEEVRNQLKKEAEEFMQKNILPKCDIDHVVPGQGCAPPPDFKDARPQAG